VIQVGFLPEDFPDRLGGYGLVFQAALEPAREVGGDLYEVLRGGNDSAVVVIGDVSGKGIPAALFMAVTTTLLRVSALDRDQPEDILMCVNDALVAQNPRSMFVTLSCAVFQPHKGKITIASAGHPSPVLLRPGQPPSLPVTATGMVAGIRRGTPIPSQSFDLRPGDTFVFYTDGVTEAFNPTGVQFGEQRLLEHLAKAPGKTAAETVAGILGAVRAHAGDRPQSDDITILAVRHAP
jgi:sigma-B regulation protein RsbU (phosphoserine phosphatase)